jgi:hypothetical protein
MLNASPFSPTPIGAITGMNPPASRCVTTPRIDLLDLADLPDVLALHRELACPDHRAVLAGEAHRAATLLIDRGPPRPC